MGFYNISNPNMDFNQVLQNVLNFIHEDPKAEYRLEIGSDSQVNSGTKFVTGIVIRRIGGGHWLCLKDHYVNRRIDSLREKISTEVSLSLEVAYLFLSENFPQDMCEIHLDIGRVGRTRNLIQEMVSQVAAMGLHAEIKPNSYVASSLANRYTK